MLKKRILTASVLLPLVVSAILFLPTEYFIILSSLILAVAGLEWCHLSGVNNIKVQLLLVVIVILTIAWLPFFSLLSIAWIFWSIATIAVICYPRGKLLLGYKVVAIAIGILLLVLAWQALIALRALPHGPMLILLSCSIVWAADIGAYFTGKKFGKFKLMPRVSPGKTWEGVIGAILFATITAVLFVSCSSINITLLQIIPITIITVIVSIVGDLFESIFKRVQNLKDSGNCLPGHGGLLDRIDSLLAAWPIFFLCIKYL